jgi:hypothetical protein
MVPNNRTTDTRIFSRTRDRFLFNINELEVRNQSVPVFLGFKDIYGVLQSLLE